MAAWRKPIRSALHGAVPAISGTTVERDVEADDGYERSIGRRC